MRFYLSSLLIALTILAYIPPSVASSTNPPQPQPINPIPHPGSGRRI
ncbi:hypothetical protein [Anabaena sp. CCY 9402-a]